MGRRTIERPPVDAVRTTKARECPYVIFLPFLLYVDFYSGVVLFSFIFTVRVRVIGFGVRIRDR